MSGAGESGWEREWEKRVRVGRVTVVKLGTVTAEIQVKERGEKRTTNSRQRQRG